MLVLATLVQRIGGHVSRSFALTQQVFDEFNDLIGDLGAHTDVDQARSEGEVGVKVLTAERRRLCGPLLCRFVDAVWKGRILTLPTGRVRPGLPPGENGLALLDRSCRQGAERRAVEFFEEQHLDHHCRRDRDTACAGDGLPDTEGVEEALDLAGVRATIGTQPFGKLGGQREIVLGGLDGQLTEVVQKWGLVGVPSRANVRRKGMQVGLMHRAAGDEEADIGLRVGGRQPRERDRELDDLL